MGRAAADDSHLMAEQVRDLDPPGGQPGFASGEPTLSATPLAWTRAESLWLAANVAAGRNLRTPQIVACR
jgi:glucoamylase